MDLSVLRQELSNDPRGVGYRNIIRSTDMDLLTRTLNSKTGSWCVDRIIESVNKGDFLLAFIPGIINLDSKTTFVKQKWNLILNVLFAMPERVKTSNQNIRDILQLAVTDGLVQAAYFNNFFKEKFSIIEDLYGEGKFIDIDTVSMVSRGIY